MTLTLREFFVRSALRARANNCIRQRADLEWATEDSVPKDFADSLQDECYD